MRIEWDRDGLADLTASMRALGPLAKREWTQALVAEAEGIMTDAKEITPVDTGNLRASGFVAPPVDTGDRIEVTMGFGGAAAPYALWVHENLLAWHQSPTQAKFLEQPFLTRTRVLIDRLLARMDAAVQRVSK